MEDRRRIKSDGFFRWLETQNGGTIRSQVSMGRSGRYWLSRLIRDTAGIRTGAPRDWDVSDPNAIKYYHGHDGFVDYTSNLKNVLLIRDPRDVLLSQIYWCVYLCMGEDYQSEEMAIDRFSDELFLSRKLDEWDNYFKTFVPLDTIVVQYERLCLFPVATLESVLTFLDFEVLRDPLAVVKKSDKERRSSEMAEYFPVDFANGFERYEAHSMRWKRDKKLNHLHERIWDRLGERMEEWGYTKDGHADSLLRG